MKFTTTPLKPETPVASVMDSINAANEYFDALSVMSTSQIKLAEVCDCMENIHTSIEFLNKYGQEGIATLNSDQSLEALTGLQDRLITLPKALAALEAADEGLWEKFKRYIKNICIAIWNLIKSIFGQWSAEEAEYKNAVAVITAASDQMVNAPVDAGTVGTAQDVKTEDADNAKLAAAVAKAEAAKAELAKIIDESKANPEAAAAKAQTVAAQVDQAKAEVDQGATSKKPAAGGEKKTLKELGWSKSLAGQYCTKLASDKSLKDVAAKVEAMSKDVNKILDTLNKDAKPAEKGLIAKITAFLASITKSIDQKRKRRRARAAALKRAAEMKEFNSRPTGNVNSAMI